MTYSKEHKTKLVGVLKRFGTLPRKDLAKKLNAGGIKTAQGLKWTADRLKSFFADYQDLRAKYAQKKAAKKH